MDEFNYNFFIFTTLISTLKRTFKLYNINAFKKFLAHSNDMVQVNLLLAIHMLCFRSIETDQLDHLDLYRPSRLFNRAKATGK